MRAHTDGHAEVGRRRLAAAVLAPALALAACAVPPAPDSGGAWQVATLPGKAAAEQAPRRAPRQVALAYRPAPARRLTLQTEWGRVADLSRGAPPFERRIEADVRTEAAPAGLTLTLERDPTVLVRGDSRKTADDAGVLRARLARDGELHALAAEIAGLDEAETRRHRARLLDGLVRRHRPPPFRRLTVPAGPGDIGGRTRARAERAAHTRAAVALSPLLALLPGLPGESRMQGGEVALMRRDFGSLFRGHPDLWTESRGRITGFAVHRGRRVAVVTAEAAPAIGPAAGWTLSTRGRGLLDLESGFYLELGLDHVLTAPAAGNGAGAAKFLVRERLTLE